MLACALVSIVGESGSSRSFGAKAYLSEMISSCVLVWCKLMQEINMLSISDYDQ